MPFQEAYNAEKPEGKEARLRLNTDIFTENGEMGEAVQRKIVMINALLLMMRAQMADDLSSDEMKAATLAIERRLENSIPADFRERYKAADTWEEAAELIQTNILDDLNRFVLEKTLQTVEGNKATELKYYVQTADNEDWTYLDSDQAENILRKLDPSVSPEDVYVFRKRYSDDNLRYREDILAQGAEALRQGYYVSR